MPARRALLIAERREPGHDMPSDGTQVVYGYPDGTILAGDAHHMWRSSDDPVRYIHPDPELAWWVNAEALRPASIDDHLAALGLNRALLQTLLRDAELGTKARRMCGFGTHHGDDGQQHRLDTEAGVTAQARLRSVLQEDAHA